MTPDVVGIQWQSGYFEASVLGVFLPAFRRLADEDLDAIVLVGSNDGATQSSAVNQLVDVLALPRPNALLGVVRYADGLYHPKTIHLRYRSGREVAYVGSANLTSRGIDGRNVEDGVILDTDEGDPVSLFSQVSQAVRDWFVSRPSGLFEVGSHDDVSRLEAQGILAKERFSGCHGGSTGASTSRSCSRTRRDTESEPSVTCGGRTSTLKAEWFGGARSTRRPDTSTARRSPPRPSPPWKRRKGETRGQETLRCYPRRRMPQGALAGRLCYWWCRAEKLAGLEPQRGRGWHSLRRKFASDLMDQPLKVLCELGGWKTAKTVLQLLPARRRGTAEASTRRPPQSSRLIPLLAGTE